jgi:chromosome segregation ATPase
MDRSSNALLSQLAGLLTTGGPLIFPLLETLLEYHRNGEITQRELREERDEAQRVLEEQRVRADTSERERDAAGEQLQDLSRQLEDTLVTNDATQQQLHERGERLADAESLVARKQAALDEIYEHCTQLRNGKTWIQNEKDLIQAQLDEKQDRVRALEEDLAESQRISGRQSAELQRLRDMLDTEKLRRETAEEQLSGTRNEISRLQANNDRLKTDVAESRRRCSDLDRQVRDFEEQNLVTSGEVNRLNEVLRGQQTEATTLRTTVTNVKRERDELHDQLQKHHARCEALREENTRLQHEKNSLEEGKQTLQARCTALDTELAEVKAILGHINNARAKLPRCLGTIRYKGKPRRM